MRIMITRTRAPIDSTLYRYGTGTYSRETRLIYSRVLYVDDGRLKIRLGLSSWYYSRSNSRHFEWFDGGARGVMLVGEAGADDEGGGASAHGSAYLRLHTLV